MSQADIKIPAELFAMAESARFDGQLSLPVLEAGPDDYRFDEPVSWHVEVTNTGAALLVMGQARGRGRCACARCLEEVELDFQGDIEGYLLIEEGAPADFGDGEDAPGEDEFEVLPADHIVDLEPMIRAALMMDAPQQPLCSDDCKGLCPSCGANLNAGPCSCGGDASLAEFDAQVNPFAVLAALKFE